MEEIEEQLDRTIISLLHLQLEHCIKLAIYVRIGVRWIKRGPSNDRRCTPEIRVRLVNTSLRYRLRGGGGVIRIPTTDSIRMQIRGHVGA